MVRRSGLRAPTPADLPAGVGVPAPRPVPKSVTRDDLSAYARSVADAAAEALPDYVSIIWKGSTHKPWEGPFDFLPGLSDVDIHVYRPGPLADPWSVRRRVLDGVGPAPVDSPLQLLVLDSGDLPDWWTVIPGTYEVMAGGPPPAEVPPTDVLLQRDRFGLAQAGRDAERISVDALGRSDDQLWEYLRGVRWMFPPALYRAVSVSTGDPRLVWSLNRSRLLALAGEDPALAKLYRATIQYYEAALAACLRPGDGAAAENALRAGQRMLRKVAGWAARRRDAVVDRRGPTQLLG